jgi:hypothetical protein
VDIQKVSYGVIGSIIVYVISKTVIDNMVTGTSVGDQLIQNTLPLVIAAGVMLVSLRMFLS